MSEAEAVSGNLSPRMTIFWFSELERSIAEKTHSLENRE
jgi:hypothetical protein